MATTIPIALRDGQPLSIQRIYDEYVRALGDSDKATDIEDACYYQGQADALVTALDILHAVDLSAEKS